MTFDPSLNAGGTTAAPAGSDPERVRLSLWIDEILSGLRVPEKPYPATRVPVDRVFDWTPCLRDAWVEQRDQPVAELLGREAVTWSLHQVNAAYIADRVMDVFLQTSGLHPVLVQQVARLRFFLAWRMERQGGSGLDLTLQQWLDSLSDWRGWSDSGGRSARLLLDQLDLLTQAVTECFDSDDTAPFERFARHWQAQAEERRERSRKLHDRLLVTERGAARQRFAEQVSRAAVGRALERRELPRVISGFVLEHWLPLLRQIAWNHGTAGEDWRHGCKLLEWLVWVADPTLSEKDRNRLYQVGEQLPERLSDVWSRNQDSALPPRALHDIEQVMVARLRGEALAMAPALPAGFEYSGEWLRETSTPSGTEEDVAGQWFVEGEGASEQRRFLLGRLPESGEILWSNGFGVKLGVMSAAAFSRAHAAGDLRPLPALNPFGKVLMDTVEALGRLLEEQQRKRQAAAHQAREKARQLRQEQDRERRAREQQERERVAEEAREATEREAQRQADEATAKEQAWQVALREARAGVDQIKLGGWISLAAKDDSEDPGTKPGSSTDPVTSPRRLKLAVRINASRKLIFVDRLGLNRTEYSFEQLTEQVARGEVRLLTSTAEFDDTLSRVVGRIRVGRS